ncbi:MAG TPA: DUF4920 domain-containing protein [Nannocystis exedens]|nr:DUF4920 domain-containing protein [Nannocystis exedens]
MPTALLSPANVREPLRPRKPPIDRPRSRSAHSDRERTHARTGDPMNLRIAAMILFAGAALTACDSGKKTEADKADKAEKTDKEVAADAKGHDAKAKPAVAVADQASAEGEEGCIYGDDKEKHHSKEEGCSHANGDSDSKAAGTGVPGHHGAAFALTENKPLREVLASADKTLPTTAIQVTGEVSSVCQKKGCWMVLKDGDSATARILMKDHSFSVPMDVKGKSAIVEGTLTARTFSEKEVKHLEKDGGGDPAEVSGERKEFVLTASGIQFPANS